MHLNQLALQLLTAPVLASLATAASAPAPQDPFTTGERWQAVPAAGEADWMPDQVRFAGEDSFIWSSSRGGTRALRLYDAVARGNNATRGVVSRSSTEYGGALVAAGTRGDAVFALRQFAAPTAFRRAPMVQAFDPRMASFGSEMAPTWDHDLDVRINGPVRMATDDTGATVVAAAWDDRTASVRLDILDGTTGTLLGRRDMPGFSLNGLAISEDGTRVAVAAGLSLYILDATGAILHSQSIPSATQALDFSANGATLAFGELGFVNILAEVPGAGYSAFQRPAGGSSELPSALSVSDDGSLIAIAWWNYVDGVNARFEIYDTIFQFPLASSDQFSFFGGSQNLPTSAWIADDGYTAAFSLWGNGTDPEVVVIEAGGFGPSLQIDLPGSARGMDVDASGTRFAVAHKDVHSSIFGSTGAVRLIDSGKRALQLTSTPSIGGSLDAVASSPGSFSGWFLIGPKGDTPLQFPGVTGQLLVRRGQLNIIPRLMDSSGRMEMSLPLPNDAGLVGTQTNIQAAFRTPGGLVLTPRIVSPYIVR